MKLKDLTGQTFGRWTVLERAENEYTSGGNPKVMWKCKCSCENGTVKNIPAGSLLNGNSKSCGCWNLERGKLPKMYNRKQNTYDLDSHEYGIGTTSDGSQFIFDKEDYDLISQFCWYEHHKYFVAKDIRSTPNKTICMHKLLMNCEHEGRSVKVDHQDGNPSNNRKSNLRIATTSENNANRKSNSKSGVCGVRWHKRDQKWEVFVKHIYIGRTPDYAEAVRMRAKAEDKYYGEFGFFRSRKIDVEEFIRKKLREFEENNTMEAE